MSIAIVTGASSGIGKELFRRIPAYMQADAVWVIGRSEASLEALRPLSPLPLRILPLDLSKPEDTAGYAQLLEAEQPEVGLLIHAAGYGKFGRYDDFPLSQALNMVDLNIRGTVAVVQSTLDYMLPGSRILVMGSAAAFQPLPYINVYGSSKAFVLHYCRALYRELKPRQISVTCVCPYWVKTPFFDRAEQTKNPHIIPNRKPLALPERVAEKALRDTFSGRELSSYGLINRVQQFLARVVPQRLVIWVYMRMQGLGGK